VPSGPSDDFASPTSPPPNSEGPLTLNDADLEYLKRLNANRSQASAFDTNAPAAASPIPPEGPLTLNDAYLECLKRLNANRSQASAFDTNAPAAASPIPSEGPLTLNDAYLEYLKRLNANRSQASAVGTGVPAAPLVPFRRFKFLGRSSRQAHRLDGDRSAKSGTTCAPSARRRSAQLLRRRSKQPWTLQRRR
jgi:hypothetical protein